MMWRVDLCKFNPCVSIFHSNCKSVLFGANRDFLYSVECSPRKINLIFAILSSKYWEVEDDKEAVLQFFFGF